MAVEPTPNCFADSDGSISKAAMRLIARHLASKSSNLLAHTSGMPGMHQ